MIVHRIGEAQVKTMRVAADYYRQFDADFARDVPAEGYGGWKRTRIEISRERSAVVLMHAWDCGPSARYPGWRRCVEYLPRADEICRTILPPLLAAVRRSGMTLIHVVSSAGYCRNHPGYRRAVALAGPEPPPPENIPSCPTVDALRKFKSAKSFVGAHNRADVQAGLERLDFHAQARPVGDEGIAANSHQLFALCKPGGINHLIYAGFAVNWCLLMASGGMLDMSRRGFMCSALRQAVTAVENRDTARLELSKELALWRVAVAFGFVFNVEDFIEALAKPD